MSNSSALIRGPFTYLPCPGTEQYADCQYVTTSDPISSQSWTCRQGYYCPDSNSTPLQCDQGFFCPQNARQPIYCPPGYSCSSSADSIQRCPSGYYCPLGTVTPYPCIFGACGSGTVLVDSKPYAAILIGSAALILYLCYLQIVRLDRFKAFRHRQKLFDTVLAHSSSSLLKQQSDKKSSTALSSNSSSSSDRQSVRSGFQIDFYGLGLVLSSGVEVMRNVSGSLKPGRTCAIMGPSGSGKTTLISLLTGKVKKSSGRIVINGRDDEVSRYRRMVGFVPQEDVMLRQLTVHEILKHSASMRLPRNTTPSDISSIVLENVSFLGLDNVMDSVIGDEESRGISGGQRKRVNIGMELVANPSILFLDEPTSGLDSSTSRDICQLLRSIARERNMLVAAIIHSPSAASFNCFDDLCLLGKGGELVYFGAREDALDYFDKCGFACPPNETPSDFYMDIVMGKVESYLKADFSVRELPLYWKRYCNGLPPVQLPNNTASLLVAMPTTHTATDGDSNSFKKELQNEALSFYSTNSSNVSVRDRGAAQLLRYLDMVKSVAIEAEEWLIDVSMEFSQYCRNWLNFLTLQGDRVRDLPLEITMVWLLFKRSVRQIWAAPTQLLTDMVLHVGAGLLIAYSTQKFDFINRAPEQVCMQVPLLIQESCRQASDSIPFLGIFLSVGIVFCGITSGSSTFGLERTVYWRDSASGMPTTPYFFAKLIADLPRLFLASLLFTTSYVVFGTYRSDILSLFGVFSVLYFDAFAMGYLVSIIVPRNLVSLCATLCSLVFCILFSGQIPALTELSPSIRFIWDLSAPRWALEAIWVQEIRARSYSLSTITPPNYYNVQNGYLIAIRNMVLIGVGWCVAAFLGLKLLNRRKKK